MFTRATRIALTFLVAATAIFSAVQVANGSDKHSYGGYKKITVTHGATDGTNSQQLDLGEPGHSVGDMLTVYIPFTGKYTGQLVGSLTTVAVDKPVAGKDVRTSELTFVFGDNKNQIVVGGQAVYEIAEPTLSVGVVTTRPVLGGSGKYAGATGYVESTRLQDNTWKHVFYIRYN